MEQQRIGKRTWRDRERENRTPRKRRSSGRSGRGESLVETLAALLVIVMGMTIFPGAVIAAARVNHAAERQTVVPETAREETVYVEVYVEERKADGTFGAPGRLGGYTVVFYGEDAENALLRY